MTNRVHIAFSESGPIFRLSQPGFDVLTTGKENLICDLAELGTGVVGQYIFGVCRPIRGGSPITVSYGKTFNNPPQIFGYMLFPTASPAFAMPMHQMGVSEGWDSFDGIANKQGGDQFYIQNVTTTNFQVVRGKGPNENVAFYPAAVDVVYIVAQGA